LISSLFIASIIAALTHTLEKLVEAELHKKLPCLIYGNCLVRVCCTIPCQVVQEPVWTTT